ncbi:MAG: serine hydrolase [Bacteroidetes bacterium]|jgi:CubicO group peptidase (beta-lactamase class C family)|nr:serine hydrolase [Bacteroidota bacterium]
MKNIRTLLFATTLCIVQIATAQTITEGFVDSIVQKSMDLIPQAGVAVAVIQDGKVVLSKGYGVASVETKAKVDENTLFSIASNSKAFTTMALGLLVDQGKLDWKDKVVDYIPEFKMYDPYVTENFNIQDLLTHRSGLGLGAGDLMFIPSGGDYTIDDIIKSFQYQTPVSAFRTKYDYDNLLYMVAGEVIHRISGESWANYVENHIMKPLNMSRSAGIYYNLKSKENIAEGHKVENDKVIQIEAYDENRAIGAAGGIYSSVADLSKWMLMHLEGGKLNDSTTFISAKNRSEMWKAHTNIYFNATPPQPYRQHYEAYGLGWKLADKNGYTTVSHTGGMPGMLSQVLMIPELSAGVVVLTNAAPGGYSFISVTREIEDALIGVNGRDWVTIMKNYIERSGGHADSVVNAVWETVDKAKTKHLILEDFVGTYNDAWFGDVEVTLKDKELWFAAKRSPKLSGKMSYYQANTFAIRWTYRDMDCDAFAIFSLDENGKAQSIDMKGISPNIDFSFDFHDLNLERVK